MQQLKLLIVDDEPSILNGLAHAIPWQSFDIEVIGLAENGVIALSIMQAQQPDIVLTDICMPMMDGLTFIEKAKAINPETQFIILSGYDNFTYAQKALSLRAATYLLKPIQLSELIDAIFAVRERIKTVQHQSTYLKSEFFSNLLSCRISPSDHFTQAFTQFQIDFPLSVCIIECPDPAIEEITAALTALETVSLRVMETKPREITFVICEKDPCAAAPLIYECIAPIAPTLSLAIGDVVTDCTMVAASHTAAKKHLEYKIYDLSPRIFTQALLQQADELQTFVPDPSFKGRIVTAILQKDADAIHTLVEAFLASILYVPMPPPRFLKGVSANLLFSVQEQLPNMQSALVSFSVQEIAQYIDTFTSLAQLKAYLADCFIEHIQNVNEAQESSEHVLIKKAIFYINNNLTNSKLNLDEVATHVHLSKNYFTSLFKAQTGTSFIDYLMQQKMDYAKKQLEHAEMSIQQIAHTLGYEDTSSFHRAFKRTVGVSPAAYKKIYDQMR